MLYQDWWIVFFAGAGHEGHGYRPSMPLIFASPGNFACNRGHEAKQEDCKLQ
jgi:hypothetical protein